MGRLTGIATGLIHPVVTQTTPGDMLAIGGWIALLSPAVGMVVVNL